MKLIYTSVKQRVTVFLLFLLAICPLRSWSQTSYQMIMDSTGYYFDDVMVNEAGEPLMLMVDAPDPNNSYHFYLTSINGQPGTADGWKVTINGGQATWFANQTSYNGKMACFAHSNASSEASFGCIDIETGMSWAKSIHNHGYVGAYFCRNQSGNTFLLNCPTSSNGLYSTFSVVELYKLDAMGNTIWKKGMVLHRDSLVVNAYINATGIGQDKDGNIYIMGSLRGFSQWDWDTKPYEFFLIKLDPMGTPLIWKRIDGHYLGKIAFANDGILLLDKGYFDHASHTFDLGEPFSANLIKLDYDLNFVWAKRYSGDHFYPYYSASIEPTASGKLLMSHSLQADFPVILTELDAEGNILSQKGYSHNQSRMHALEDGSFILASYFHYPGAGPVLHNVIAKSDTEGNIVNCPTLPTCLKVEDLTVQFGKVYIDTITALDIQPLPITAEPVAFSFSDFCGFPSLPVPNFTFPDTLCIGGIDTTLSDDNRLANAREWHLTGPNTDTLLLDAFEFAYQFTLPGDYLLRQSIWVLGCRYDYERNVTVLPPLTVEITDTLLCPAEPLEVSAAANRSASFVWNTPGVQTGQVGPSVPFIASGSYIVTATDDYCEAATDTANVGLATDLLGNNPPFSLPPDTMSCLPFELVPQSLFNNQFFLDTDLTPATSFVLESAGTYQIGMEVFGCMFWEAYQYEVDCHIDVYLPNSFSPNSDGINDVFQPFGPAFEVLDLSIFDRWGGLVHQGLDWDGGRASQGIYTYKLAYINLLSLKTETVYGDVVLLR